MSSETIKPNGSALTQHTYFKIERNLFPFLYLIPIESACGKEWFLSTLPAFQPSDGSNGKGILRKWSLKHTRPFKVDLVTASFLNGSCKVQSEGSTLETDT